MAKGTTPETAARVEAAIVLIFELKSAKEAIKAQGLSSETFYRYLEENPELANLYRRAQNARAELFADEIIEIADNDPDPQRARNRIDSRKWYASKTKPEKFGDRVDLNVSGSIDILAALEAGKQRALLPLRYPTEPIPAEFSVIKQKVLDGATGSEPVKDQEPSTQNEGDADSREPNPLD